MDVRNALLPHTCGILPIGTLQLYTLQCCGCLQFQLATILPFEAAREKPFSEMLTGASLHLESLDHAWLSGHF